MIVYYYTLTDPITGEICYIGQTTRPEKRRSEHINPGNLRGGLYLSMWLSDLHERGVEAIFTIIETVEDDIDCWMHPTKRESEIIADYWAKGHPLLNSPKKTRSFWLERIRAAKFVSRLRWYI